MTINRNNYEEYFLLYIDRELGRDEKLMVEDYVRQNPDLEKEFNLLKQTTAIPPVMVFEGKETLLKEEKERRIFPLFWMRIAATLIILLAGGWFLLVITGRKGHPENITASNQIAIRKDGNKTKIPELSAKPANQLNSENAENLQNENPVAVTNSANGQKENSIREQKQKAYPVKRLVLPLEQIHPTRLRFHRSKQQMRPIASAGKAVNRQPTPISRTSPKTTNCPK